jgi:hypothetical protein
VSIPKRNKGPARWLLIGLSGLATAGFLGTIVSQANQAQTAPPTDTVAAASAPAGVTISAPQQSVAVTEQLATSVQPTIRTARLRTRGS